MIRAPAAPGGIPVVGLVPGVGAPPAAVTVIVPVHTLASLLAVVLAIQRKRTRLR